ncbi:MAG: hypothetical protein CMA72_07025 [Euryarchaeota archaeon]|nr:hypothetical protein [Euryarchaeota archaeon]|tara:strand:+ start:30753 stop:30938 length:186 start_codon:yes stop_codon:yes gene_type:complete
MIEQPLNDSVQHDLRAKGILSENEIAVKAGDLHVAQNVVTGDRRVITVIESVTETKQVLRG